MEGSSKASLYAQPFNLAAIFIESIYFPIFSPRGICMIVKSKPAALQLVPSLVQCTLYIILRFLFLRSLLQRWLKSSASYSESPLRVGCLEWPLRASPSHALQLQAAAALRALHPIKSRHAQVCSSSHTPSARMHRRVTVLCVSVKSHLTSGASVCPVTYSAGNGEFVGIL